MLSWPCLLTKVTRSLSYLFEKKIGRHGSIRTAEARVYETDMLHGRIMSVNSLGYGNHPLFSARFQRASGAAKRTKGIKGLNGIKKLIEYTSK